MDHLRFTNPRCSYLSRSVATFRNFQESFEFETFVRTLRVGLWWVRMTGGECSMSKAVTLREAVELEKEEKGWNVSHSLNLKPPQPPWEVGKMQANWSQGDTISLKFEMNLKKICKTLRSRSRVSLETVILWCT